MPAFAALTSSTASVTAALVAGPNIANAPE
jgi:hypothetical protein